MQYFQDYILIAICLGECVWQGKEVFLMHSTKQTLHRQLKLVLIPDLLFVNYVTLD